MHDLPKPKPSTPIRFVNTRCPKCHRVTSRLSFRTSSVSCNWTDCGHTWIEHEREAAHDRPVTAQDRPSS
jgi:ribosomal protein S27E